MTSAFSLFAAGALAGALAGAPQGGALRAVSLDFCADQFLLALASPHEIAGVSPGADDDYSYLREKARAAPKVRPTVEEVAALKPDVALRFWGGSPRLAAALERLGVKVETLGYASDFDGVRANISRAAALLGRAEAGQAMIADLDRRLAALKERPHREVSALYVTPGGVTAGKGTMIDAIFRAAGVRNAAAEAGLSYWPPLPAEALVLKPPQMIVAGFFESDDEAINHWSAARHPAFKSAFARTPTLHLDADILSCPAWFAVDAAEAIADFAAELEGSQP